MTKKKEKFSSRGLKEFCFDVLGDFIPESSYYIDEQHHRVMVFHLFDIPSKVVAETWEKAKKGTPYENFVLFLPLL